MAKTPKVKKREVSIHSRAARRNASPPAKDLAVKGATTDTEYKPWLHSAQNAGISKKKKVKNMTRQQKMRQQKGAEKADAIEGKLEKKVQDSKTRAKKIKSRAVEWEELNDKLEGKGRVLEKKPVDQVKMEDVVVPDLEQPVGLHGAESSEGQDTTTNVPITAAGTVDAVAVPLPVPEDDEIL